jgi:hypothetical protein
MLIDVDAFVNRDADAIVHRCLRPTTTDCATPWIRTWSSGRSEQVAMRLDGAGKDFELDDSIGIH